MGGRVPWKAIDEPAYRRDVRKHVGRDGSLGNRLHKARRKVLEDPERAGDWKRAALKNHLSCRVGHFVILYRFDPDAEEVFFRRFIHHNDPMYDP